MAEKLTNFIDRIEVNAYLLATTAFKYRKEIFYVILLTGLTASALAITQSVLASGETNPIDIPICSNPDTGVTASTLFNLDTPPSMQVSLSTHTPLSIGSLCDQAAAVTSGDNIVSDVSSTCKAVLSDLGQPDSSISLDTNQQGFVVFREQMSLFHQQWKIDPKTLGELTCATPPSQGWELFHQKVLGFLSTPQGIIAQIAAGVFIFLEAKYLYEHSEGRMLEKDWVKTDADELAWGQVPGKLTFPVGAEGPSAYIAKHLKDGKILVKVGQIKLKGPTLLKDFQFDPNTVRYIEMTEDDFWNANLAELNRSPDSILPVKK